MTKRVGMSRAEGFEVAGVGVEVKRKRHQHEGGSENDEDTGDSGPENRDGAAFRSGLSDCGDRFAVQQSELCFAKPHRRIDDRGEPHWVFARQRHDVIRDVVT